jgi:predicted transcriptional regulator
MPFELVLRYSAPLTSVETLDEALSEFLRLVGYLKEGELDKGSTAYRLMRDCFLGNPGRPWTIEELAATLKTTKPTIYRHLNRLKALDLMEEITSPSEKAKGRKGYRLRYGNLARAWDFVEANAQNSLRRYREGVDHIQKLVEKNGAKVTSNTR